MSSFVPTPGAPTGPQLDNRRIAAALIDLGVPLAMGAAGYAAGLSMTRGLVLVAIGWTLYYFFALESGDGQTLGKRVMKLRVVSADGTPATMGQIAKRTVVRILDGHIVGLIVMLATGERRQRLGDIVAGTVVTEAGPIVVPLSEAEPELPGGSEAELEPFGDPPSEPGRRTPRKPSFAKAGLGKLSFGRSTQHGSTSETSPWKRPLALPSLRMPSLRKHTERPEPTREGSPAATPTPVGRAQPMAELGHRETATELNELEPVGYGDGDPSVELERDPVVELDELEPAHDYLVDEPLVELADPDSVVEVAGPQPVVELEHEPTVELEYEPSVELEVEPAVELEREPAVELEVEPAVELERDPSVELGEPPPPPEPDPERPSEPAQDEELTVKPIQTVSAIDLVMQDAEQRRLADP